jgi:hypothetical protein
MRKVKEKKVEETIEERAERYQKEMEAEELNNTIPVEAIVVEEIPHNGHKKEAPVEHIKPAAPVSDITDDTTKKKINDGKELAKALEKQQMIDREKEIPGIGSIVAADDEKLKELTNITSDTAFTYSVMDMQDAIFNSANDIDAPPISLRQILKNGHMRYSKSINGDGIVQILKAMEYKTTAQAQSNGLNLFGDRNK